MTEAIHFLGQLDLETIVLMFWHALLIELPRFSLAAISSPVAPPATRRVNFRSSDGVQGRGGRW